MIDEEKRRVHLPRTAQFGVFLVPEKVLQEACEDGNRLTASNLMTRKVVTLPEETPAREVVVEMLARKVNRIPITCEGKLVGIVTRGAPCRRLRATGVRRPSGPKRAVKRVRPQGPESAVLAGDASHDRKQEPRARRIGAPTSPRPESL
jgi:CBS-domain-containing membrane protein